MTPKSSPPRTFSLISNAKLRQMYVTMLQYRILAAHARLHVLKGREAPFAGAEWSCGQVTRSFPSTAQLPDICFVQTLQQSSMDSPYKNARQFSACLRRLPLLREQRWQEATKRTTAFSLPFFQGKKAYPLLHRMCCALRADINCRFCMLSVLLRETRGRPPLAFPSFPWMPRTWSPSIALRMNAFCARGKARARVCLHASPGSQNPIPFGTWSAI